MKRENKLKENGMLLKISSTVIVFASLGATAQDSFLDQFTQAELSKMKQIEGCATQTQHETILYHWGKKVPFYKKKDLNNVDKYKKFMLGKGTSQNAKMGKGYYLSKYPNDSSIYGDRLSVTHIKKGVPFLDLDNSEVVNCLKYKNITIYETYQLSPNVLIGRKPKVKSTTESDAKWYVLKLRNPDTYFINEKVTGGKLTPTFIKNNPKLFGSKSFASYLIGKHWKNEKSFNNIALTPQGKISEISNHFDFLKKCSLLIKNLDFSNISKYEKKINFKLSKECDYQNIEFRCSNDGFCKNKEYQALIDFNGKDIKLMKLPSVRTSEERITKSALNKLSLKSEKIEDNQINQCINWTSENNIETEVRPKLSVLKKIINFLKRKLHINT